ncbi:MAG: hypothetical protein K2P85_03600 [Flavobacteriaceae bacterium]|nr:hypothetical protein [Flavobacteriaceae bacterium]
METIKLYCKKCSVALTNDLTKISDSEITWLDERNSIPENRYLISSESDKATLLLAIDTYLLKDNPINRDCGCCGNSNNGSYNKICANGHEVATRIDDCFTGFYIEFDLNKIIIKEKNKDGYAYAK